MIAFTKNNIRQLGSSLDFLNIMTYDLMNRRDKVTRHHTGVQISLDGLNAYLENGLLPSQANLGFAFYVKWFKTSLDHSSECLARNGIGCKTRLLEDPQTGADLGLSGSFSWHDQVPSELVDSFDRAMQEGIYDLEGGGHYFWDEEQTIFWTWDTPEAIHQKFPLIVDDLDLGGVFAWGLGEDAPDFKHLRALTAALRGSPETLRSAGIHDQSSEGHGQWKDEL